MALIVFVLPCYASKYCEITLQWPSITPEPAGYRVYGREEGLTYNYEEPWWEGDYTFSQCTIDQLDENTTYYFVIRVYDLDNNESNDSNEVSFRYNTEVGKSENTSSGGDANPTSSGSSNTKLNAFIDNGTAGCFLGTISNHKTHQRVSSEIDSTDQ